MTVRKGVESEWHWALQRGRESFLARAVPHLPSRVSLRGVCSDDGLMRNQVTTALKGRSPILKPRRFDHTGDEPLRLYASSRAASLTNDLSQHHRQSGSRPCKCGSRTVPSHQEPPVHYALKAVPQCESNPAQHGRNEPTSLSPRIPKGTQATSRQTPGHPETKRTQADANINAAKTCRRKSFQMRIIRRSASTP